MKYLIDCLMCGVQEVDRSRFMAYIADARGRYCPSCRYAIKDNQATFIHPRIVWR